MNILYLSHRIPYPPNKGDKIRSFNQIKYLSQSGYEIHLLSLVDQREDLEYEQELYNWCTSVYLEYRAADRAKLKSLPFILSSLPLSVPYFYSRSLQAEVDRILGQKDFDIIFCFSSVMGEYVIRSQGYPFEGKLLVMDFCDLDSDKWLQYNRSTRAPMSWIYGREGISLLRYEQALNRVFDLSVFVSWPEAELFRPLADCPDKIRVVPNGVDSEFFSTSHHPSSKASPPSDQLSIPAFQPSSLNNPPTLLFTGAMDYQANVHGILWFHREVWPKLKEKIPNLMFYIVGANPTSEIRQLSGQGVQVTGYVEDIREYYRLAHVCVIPLQMARGVQNKALEAMAMSRPVVATSKVVQGIQARPEQDLLQADSAEEFESQVHRLLQDRGLAQDVGRKGREFILKNYDWQVNLKVLQDLLGTEPEKKSGSCRPSRGRLSPVYFLVMVLIMLMSSLWPMERTSFGASITYKLDPALQNFLHLPMFMLFAWLFLDFLQNLALKPSSKYGIFTVAGTIYCLFLESLQMAVPGRFVSLTDIAFNITGLLMGWGLSLVFAGTSLKIFNWASK